MTVYSLNNLSTIERLSGRLLMKCGRAGAQTHGAVAVLTIPITSASTGSGKKNERLQQTHQASRKRNCLCCGQAFL